MLAQQSVIAVWCLAVSDKGRTFVSEHPQWAQGAGSPCPAGAGCRVFKKDMSTLHLPRKCFLAYAGVFFLCALNLLYVTLDTVVLLPRCTGVSLLVKEGMRDKRLILNWMLGYNPHGPLEMSESNIEL